MCYNFNMSEKKKSPKVNIRSRQMLPKYTDEELTVLASRIGLTLDQLKRYGNAAYRTYAAIGGDLAEVCPRGMKRYDVVEVALDADHISIYGDLEPDLKAWRANRFNLNYKLEDYYAAVAAVAFPYPLYE
jgi:hypothetical protein